MLFKLAWRNIWRNKKRTFITIASVFFAVILAVLTKSANTGIYDRMVHNVVAFSSGYIQLHNKGYWNERSIENSFPEDKKLFGTLASINGVTEYLPRLESFALASSGDKTKGVLLLGVIPQKEDNVTQLSKKLVKGKYITENDSSVLISEGMAESIGLGINDTLILLSQGYHGSSAAAQFPIKGIVRYGSPVLNRRLVNLPLQQMQKMFSAENLLSSVSLMMKEGANMPEAKKNIFKVTDTLKYEVMDWKQMMPELDQLIESDSASDYIVIGILYLVIAFGVFGTILMMTRERMHEFGILIALGMKKRYLATIVMIESFLITFIATIAGMLCSLPIILWFKYHPIHLGKDLQKVYDRYGIEAIIPFSNKPNVFIEQTQIVFVLAVLLSMYAVYKVLRINAIKAIKS